MQRMSRGRDQWQLNVHGLHSLNNVTARGSDQESFQSRKAIFDQWEQSGFPWKQKKGDLFFQKLSGRRTILFHKIQRHWWRSPKPRRRWQKTLLPFVDHTVEVSWQRDTLLQQHWRHNTGELRNAHHSGMEHCREACKNDGISCCQRRHCGVHDGIGHAKPPQLGVGTRRPSLPVCRRTPGLVRCSHERPGMMAHGNKKDVLTENKHPPPRRAASDPPRSNWRASTSPRPLRWEEDHVLEPLRCAWWRWTCQTSKCGRRDRTPARWWHPGSENEDCPFWVSLKMAPKFSKGPTTTIGEWRRNNLENPLVLFF